MLENKKQHTHTPTQNNNARQTQTPDNGRKTRQTDRQTNIQTYTYTHTQRKQTERQTHIQTNRHTNLTTGDIFVRLTPTDLPGNLNQTTNLLLYLRLVNWFKLWCCERCKLTLTVASLAHPTRQLCIKFLSVGRRKKDQRRRTDRWTDRHTERQTDTQTHTERHKTHIHTDRMGDNWQTDRTETDRQTDRQTKKHVNYQWFHNANNSGSISRRMTMEWQRTQGSNQTGHRQWQRCDKARTRKTAHVHNGSKVNACQWTRAGTPHEMLLKPVRRYCARAHKDLCMCVFFVAFVLPGGSGWPVSRSVHLISFCWMRKNVK